MKRVEAIASRFPVSVVGPHGLEYAVSTAPIIEVPAVRGLGSGLTSGCPTISCSSAGLRVSRVSE